MWIILSQASRCGRRCELCSVGTYAPVYTISKVQLTVKRKVFLRNVALRCPRKEVQYPVGTVVDACRLLSPTNTHFYTSPLLSFRRECDWFCELFRVQCPLYAVHHVCISICVCEICCHCVELSCWLLLAKSASFPFSQRCAEGVILVIELSHSLCGGWPESRFCHECGRQGKIQVVDMICFSTLSRPGMALCFLPCRALLCCLNSRWMA
jgi:hypothetical protein